MKVDVCTNCEGVGCRLCLGDLRRCYKCGKVSDKAEMYIYDDAYEWQCTMQYDCRSRGAVS